MESAPAPLRAGTNPPDHILVVEDDSSIRQLNSEVLLRSGYEVNVAVDGADAWAELSADDYDLVITDNVMPKVTGVELLKKLHAARMDLPVIMATGKLPAEEFTRYPWLQPAATLLKPYTIEELLRTVKKVLRETEGPSDAGRPGPAREMMPNSASPARAFVATPPPDVTNFSHRILVVDEDRDLGRLYAEALAGPGYAIDVVTDGAAAWAALQAKSYNLLITEHDLPKLTGVALVRKLRAAYVALPVIMVAGRLPTDELAANPGLLLAATLVKPFAVDALLDLVKNVLRAADRARDQLDPLPNWADQPAAAGWRL